MDDADNPALADAFERLETIISELAELHFDETPPEIDAFFTKAYAAFALLGPTPCEAPVPLEIREVRAEDDELLAAVQAAVRQGELALAQYRR